MAISSYNVTLKYGSTTASETVVIKDFPDLFGEPNLLETTTLSDDSQTFIPGIKQMELMTFTLNYDKAVCKKIKESEGSQQKYELTFSDGSKFTWSGQHTLGIAGAGVDEVVEASLNVVPSTPITASFGTSS